MITKEILHIFRNDLWKDKRLMDPQDEFFVKKSENEIEHKAEISVLQYLQDIGIDGIPKIKKTDGLDIHMSIFKGIRVFELLVILDEISLKFRKAIDVKKIIVDRCDERQRRIQFALKKWRESEIENGVTRIMYPQNKIKKIVEVLAVCKNISYDRSGFDREMEQLICYWESVVNIPFRDATTKHMVFCDPNFQRIELDPHESKTERNIKQIINKLDDDLFWEKTPIADFDFSSCMYDTTMEDDYISLHCHERTFDGNTYMVPDDLLWMGAPDFKRAAISFYVRYYRFGGRKAAYRLLNPVNHMVRFENDHDDFYFKNLNSIMRNLWSSVDKEFPVLMKLTDSLSRTLGTNRAITDAFYSEYPNAFRQPWTGLCTVKIDNIDI